jgi:hypothetical protein
MVGGKVRQTIKDIGGVLPEDLPSERHIRELEKEKRAAERFLKPQKKSKKVLK